MSEFSPGFEQYLQGVERRENPPPPILPPVPTLHRERSMTRRVRVRKTICVIPDCTSDVRRINTYPLCTEHLLRIWKMVEGDHLLDGKGHHADGTGITPALITVTTEEQEAQRLAKRQKLREAATNPGRLYVLDSRDGLVKIGWTGRDLYHRMAQYPPTFGLIVNIAGTRADERDTHRSLKLSRRKGREWYEVTPEVVRLINDWIAIANTVRAQRATDVRVKAVEAIEAGNPAPWFRTQLHEQATFIPKFVSLDDWASKRQKLKSTGTEPEGYFRA